MLFTMYAEKKLINNKSHKRNGNKCTSHSPEISLDKYPAGKFLKSEFTLDCSYENKQPTN